MEPKRHNQRLNLDAAREIRRLRSEEGLGVPEIAQIFDVPKSTVGQVLRGETWREPDAFPRRKPSAPVSSEQAAKIKRLASEPGLSQERIGFLAGVSAATVRKVLKDQVLNPHTKVYIPTRGDTSRP